MDAHFALVEVTGPSAEPVTLPEAKLHLRVTNTSEDELIGSLISAARQYGEERTNRAFMPQTWDLVLDRFPCGEDAIEVPKSRLQAVTYIRYVDTDGETATLSATGYRVDGSSEPGRIEPAWGEHWPSVRDVNGAVTVRFVAGYTSATATAPASSVPDKVKAAIKVHVGHMYENRSAVEIGTIATQVPMAVDALYGQVRVLRIG